MVQGRPLLVINGVISPPHEWSVFQPYRWRFIHGVHGVFSQIPIKLWGLYLLNRFWWPTL